MWRHSARCAGVGCRMGVIEIEGLRKEYAKLRGGRTVAVAGARPLGPDGRRVRVPRAERRRQDDDDPLSARARAAECGPDALLGADVRRDLPSVIGRVGSIVEAPAMFPRFRGRRNLEILARIHGEGDDRDRRGARARRAHRSREGSREDLLARHEAAAGDRGDAAARSRAADPGRAGQRARPGGDRRGARARAVARRRGPHDLHLEPHPVRGAADRRPRRDRGEGQADHVGAGRRGPDDRRAGACS